MALTLNTSFLLMIRKEWREEKLFDLVSIGTSGLYTVHNSFKHGENSTERKMKKITVELWLRSEVPKYRRSDSEIAVTDSDYPLKFCGHRWVGNESLLNCMLYVLTCQRALCCCELTCQCVLLAYMLTCQRAWRAKCPRATTSNMKISFQWHVLLKFSVLFLFFFAEK